MWTKIFSGSKANKASKQIFWTPFVKFPRRSSDLGSKKLWEISIKILKFKKKI